jgi:hypothetical protein
VGRFMDDERLWLGTNEAYFDGRKDGKAGGTAFSRTYSIVIWV